MPTAARALRDDSLNVTEDTNTMLKPTALATGAVTAAAALALPACGTARSDADAVKATTRAWLTAVTDGRTHDACALMTAKARERFTANTAVLLTPTCEQRVHDITTTLTPAERREMPDARINRVTFNARHTVARVADADVTLPPDVEPDDNGRPTILVKQPGGRWVIDDLG